MLLHIHIQHADEPSTGVTVTAGQRNVLAEVAAKIDHPNEGKNFREVLEHLRRVVRTAVVYENQLHLWRNGCRPEMQLECPQKFLAEFLGQIGVVEDRDDEGI